MKTRQLGPFQVSAIGLGCMNFSHGYGPPSPDEQSQAVMHQALDRGITLFDTALLYGSGLNETLVGRTLKAVRREITLCTKGGMVAQETSGAKKRKIDSRPEVIRANCEESLKRLGADEIDLYYLHRWDKTTPIEDVIGAMGRLVEQGKVKTIGLSEVSAKTLRAAHAVFPITAVQSEYSLWTRNPEIGVLKACQELGAAFVAFGTLGRGFFSGKLRSYAVVDALPQGDMRHNMPRFRQGNLTQNLELLRPLEEIASGLGCTAAQLAIAWCLAKEDHIIPIPGSRDCAHLEENLGALDVVITNDVMMTLESVFTAEKIFGNRYDSVSSTNVDTEEITSS